MDGRDGERVAAVAAALADLERVVMGLDVDDAARRTGCPGWNVFDVVAHCVSLESLLAGDAHPDHELEVEPDHVRTETNRFMEVLVDARREMAFDDLRAEMVDVFGRRQHQLAVLHDLDVEVPSFVGTGQARQLLGARTFDLWVHEQDLRRAVGRPGGCDTEPATASALRIVRGLESVLPQRMGEHAGELELVVTGPQPSTTTIILGGGHDRLRMTIDFADLVPIACGREDAPDPASVAVIEGDTSMAARVLTSMVITI